MRRLKLGMIGIGVGGAEILRAIDGMETIEIVAGADIVPETLERFRGASRTAAPISRLKSFAVMTMSKRSGSQVQTAFMPSTRYWLHNTASTLSLKNLWPFRWLKRASMVEAAESIR